MVGQLLTTTSCRGNAFTFGDAFAKVGHMTNSLHYERLAVDLNLFINGVWITKDHPEWQFLGAYWKGLHPLNRWGGDIVQKVDLNHFSAVPSAADKRT